MKNRRSIAFIVLGICSIAAVTMLVLQTEKVDLTNVSPVIQLRDGDDTIIVFLDEKGEQRFTVTGNDGETKVELVTLKELQAKLPGAGERVAGGLASIWAGNESGGGAVLRSHEGSISIKDVGDVPGLEGQPSQRLIKRILAEPGSSPKTSD